MQMSMSLIKQHFEYNLNTPNKRISCIKEKPSYINTCPEGESNLGPSRLLYLNLREAMTKTARPPWPLLLQLITAQIICVFLYNIFLLNRSDYWRKQKILGRDCQKFQSGKNFLRTYKTSFYFQLK